MLKFAAPRAPALVLWLIFWAAVPALAAFVVPRLDSAVTDNAGLLSSQTRSKLESALRDLNARGKAQVAILTVPSLEGEPIEQASIKITDQWKLGTAKKDNGILFLISRDDRELRIEVGQGLEGDLPDAYAKRIIDTAVVPRFREHDFEGGIVAGTREIIRRTDPDFSLDAVFGSQNFDSGAGGGSSLFGSALAGVLYILLIRMGGIWFILILLAAFLGPRGRGRGGRGGGLGGGYWGGYGGGSGWGGGGGWSSSSGGFGGGGGGFSGGGASGRW